LFNNIADPDKIIHTSRRFGKEKWWWVEAPCLKPRGVFPYNFGQSIHIHPWLLLESSIPHAFFLRRTGFLAFGKHQVASGSI
jgi:hypothetical protein